MRMMRGSKTKITRPLLLNLQTFQVNVKVAPGFVYIVYGVIAKKRKRGGKRGKTKDGTHSEQSGDEQKPQVPTSLGNASTKDGEKREHEVAFEGATAKLSKKKESTKKDRGQGIDLVEHLGIAL